MIYHLIFTIVALSERTSYIIRYVHTLCHTIAPVRCVFIESKDGVRNSKLRKVFVYSRNWLKCLNTVSVTLLI